jgi:hypothetical protein
MVTTLASSDLGREAGLPAAHIRDGRAGKMDAMDTTGWITGQLFLQTVDDGEVKTVSDFLNSRGIAFQVLTLSERMTLDPTEPDQGVSTDRFSIAVQLGGFPQVVGPVLNELIQRSHGGGWQAEPQT